MTEFETMTFLINDPNLCGFLHADITVIPRHYCQNPSNVFAFILGADPGNFTIGGKSTKILNTVFGIGDGDARYFNPILLNLKEVGLSLEDIYVQNLVRNYLTFETSRNPAVWLQFAEKWLPYLKEEFDSIDKSGKTLVLVTAEVIFRFLNPAMAKYSAKEIYNPGEQGKIFSSLKNADNPLERPVIPLYRHLNYKLSKVEFKSYKEFICSILVKNEI